MLYVVCYIYIYIHTYTRIRIHIRIRICIHIHILIYTCDTCIIYHILDTAHSERAARRALWPKAGHTVSSPAFKSQSFKARGSNPRIAAYPDLNMPCKGPMLGDRAHFLQIERLTADRSNPCMSRLRAEHVVQVAALRRRYAAKKRCRGVSHPNLVRACSSRHNCLKHMYIYIYTHTYTYIYLSISLSLSIYIYIYIYVYHPEVGTLPGGGGAARCTASD